MIDGWHLARADCQPSSPKKRVALTASTDTMNTAVIPTMKSLVFSLAVLLLLAATALPATAQVNVAPNRLIMTSKERSKEISMSNPTNAPMEVETRVVYALLKSDSIGAMKYDSVDLGPTARPSCAEWIKVFPKRFTLQPGEKRNVRVLLSPPGGIADGEYLARMIVSSQPVERAAPLDLDTTKVATTITTRINLGMPLIYRKGELATGIKFDMLMPTIDPKGIRLLADIEPEGNTTYRGTLFAEIFGADGASVGTTELQVGAELAIRQPMILPALKAGNYTLRVDAKPVRKGSAAGTVLPAAVVTRHYRLAVAAGGVSISPVLSN